MRSVKTQPDGATVYTDYSGDRVLAEDQAGRERVSRSDALGRVTEVWEVTPQESGAEASTVALTPFPGHAEAAHGYLTKYGYDALGNLRMVGQGGRHLGQTFTQRRFFAYDSLGRLLRVRNPEQGALAADADFPALADATSGVSNNLWSVGYAYDTNGNVSKRKDARNVVTSYSYDHLNRLSAVYDKPSNGAPDFYQLYRCDRWGNRTLDPASWQTPAPQFSVDAATNRRQCCRNRPYSYNPASSSVITLRESHS